MGGFVFFGTEYVQLGEAVSSGGDVRCEMWDPTVRSLGCAERALTEMVYWIPDKVWGLSRQLKPIIRGNQYYLSNFVEIL